LYFSVGRPSLPYPTADNGGEGAVQPPGGDVPGHVGRQEFGEEAQPPARVPRPRLRAQRR